MVRDWPRRLRNTFASGLASGLVLGLAAGLCACATAPPRAACQPGEQPATIDSLYFGTATPQGPVSPEQWQQFLGEVITPRFPAGLTSWAAAGQWRDGGGTIQKESSYVLHVVHPQVPKDDSAIREVIAIYKARFHQEAVLRVRSPACISF